MSKVILMMLLAVVSSSAMAKWVEVGDNKNSTAYANIATIRKSDDRVKMWVLFNYKTAQKLIGGPPYMSDTHQEEYDCTEWQSRTIHISTYSGSMGEGKVIDNGPGDGQWKPIMPDSRGESLLKVACGKVDFSKKEVAKEADVTGKETEDYKKSELDWHNAIKTFLQEVKVAEGFDYYASENSNLWTALDIEVKKLGNNKEYEDKGSFFFLCEAHKKVMRQFYSASYDPVKLGSICVSPGLVAKDSPASVVENSASSQKTRDTAIDRWKSVGDNRYIDTSTIQISEGLTYVWEKTVSDNQKNGYKLNRLVINCSNNTYDLISHISTDSNGNTENYDREPAKWKLVSVPPDSIGDHVISSVCSYISSPAKSAVPVMDKSESNASPKLSSTGSGFVVSASGALLTNHHVANGCSNLKIRDSSRIEYDATVVATDAKNDLALLQTSTGLSMPAATFRANGSVEAGENVVALGYPLAGVLASEVNVSFGYVSATAGLADDTSKLQISAPVQPGNSGGPLLDQAGNLIGVVVAKLDAIKVAKAIGDIPQNINFAVKGEVAQVFLKAHKVKFKTATATKKLENTDIASRGRAFTVLVECYK